ncbi:Exoribonuclease II protein [Dioscorea alata]|uniref:Exoribonuclease II protein n=2 Tax=Dioscorea alata TaxID=55571 RepID=A0ACB7TVB8_DIOAL|nr:Exoribonuclease II protein [Dioscorea alata]KAH7651875.1 Exoribonuclease II protein [Dioscorea alata]
MDSRAGERKNPNPNPNWAQLQQKLKSHRPRPSPTTNSTAEESAISSVLGKRKERSEPEPEPEVSPASVLSPTSDDCSLTKALAMDCEMVGVSSDGSKSALGRVTLVNTWGNVVYDEYVRPIERVVDFRTKISGIHPSNLKKAKKFWVVQKEVADMIKGRVLIGHALHNDLKVLLLSHPKRDIRDTSAYQPLQREGRRRALKDLADEVLGVKIQRRQHCPIEDARAAMLIYKKHKKEWEKSIKGHFRLKKKKLKNKSKKNPANRNELSMQHDGETTTG